MICPFVKRGAFEFTLSYAAIKRLHRAGLFTIHGVTEISQILGVLRGWASPPCGRRAQGGVVGLEAEGGAA